MTILSEDKRQQQFVFRFLRKAGLGVHQIARKDLPGGSGGAGEQWVRERYAIEVKECRRRAAKTALIVVIDADTSEINRRVRQLKEALGNNSRKHDEAIVHLIPKRNIETWILHLSAEQVDEETDYHNRDVDDLISSAAATFHEWTAQTPANCLPSLTAAIEETRRLA